MHGTAGVTMVRSSKRRIAHKSPRSQVSTPVTPKEEDSSADDDEGGAKPLFVHHSILPKSPRSRGPTSPRPHPMSVEQPRSWASASLHCVSVAIRDTAKRRRSGKRRRTCNEDAFRLATVAGLHYVGIFDGHGGASVSTYLRDHFHGELQNNIAQQPSESDLSSSSPGSSVAVGTSTNAKATVVLSNLESSLHTAFAHSDEKMYKQTMTAAARRKRPANCTCNFYRENPCVCSRVQHTANQGSTGTVVLVTAENIVCANVGDSEAMVMCLSEEDAIRLSLTGPVLPSEATAQTTIDDNCTSDWHDEVGEPPLSCPSLPCAIRSPSAEPLVTCHKRLFSEGPAEDEISPSTPAVRVCLASSNQVHSISSNEVNINVVPTEADDDTEVASNYESSSFVQVDQLPVSPHSHASDYSPSKSIDTSVSDEHEQATLIDGSTYDAISTRVSHSMLTVAHVPVVDETSEDYQRIRKIARSRAKDGLVSVDSDGIQRGRTPSSNYVHLDGAHKLNMTRAFGNFGLKQFATRDGAIVEARSSIITRPDTLTIPRSREQLCAVVASDGLWDNLTPKDMRAIVMYSVYEYAQSEDWTSSKADDPRRCATARDSFLEGAGKHALQSAMSHAKRANKKQDDITIVVVLFSSLIDVVFGNK
jgi:serine/threonine protein phosphatase PrpC